MIKPIIFINKYKLRFIILNRLKRVKIKFNDGPQIV